MWSKLVVALVACALLLVGCTGSTVDNETSSTGGPSMGAAVPPGTDERMLPEPVWAALERMRNEEGTAVITVAGDAYAIITAGEQPGYLVEVISTEKTGGQIEVLYAIHKPAATSIGSAITHPYNVYHLKGEAQTSISFRKTEPPKR